VIPVAVLEGSVRAVSFVKHLSPDGLEPIVLFVIITLEYWTQLWSTHNCCHQSKQFYNNFRKEQI